MKDITDHIAYGCCGTLISCKGLQDSKIKNGCILYISENVLLNKPAIEIAYQFSKELVVRSGKSKIALNVPMYVRKPLVTLDIILRLINYGLSPKLLIGLKKHSGSFITTDINDIIYFKLTGEERIKEERLMECISCFEFDSCEGVDYLTDLVSCGGIL